MALFFPWPYSHTYMWRNLSRIQALAGLPTDAQSKFHRIRRTVASHAEPAGGNAAAMLRRSNREIAEVTAEHFARASAAPDSCAEFAQQQPSALGAMGGSESSADNKKSLDVRKSRVIPIELVGGEGPVYPSFYRDTAVFSIGGALSGAIIRSSEARFDFS